MCRRKLCPHCKTGKYTHELDSRSPECPYLACHNGVFKLFICRVDVHTDDFTCALLKKTGNLRYNLIHKNKGVIE